MNNMLRNSSSESTCLKIDIQTLDWAHRFQSDIRF